MKVKIRKSSLKARKQHGFRSKPDSHKPKGTKSKNRKKVRRKLREHHARS